MTCCECNRCETSWAAASLPACCMGGTRNVVDTTIDEELFKAGMGSWSFCAWRVLVIDLTGSGWRRAKPSSAAFVPSTLMTWVLVAGATETTMDG